MRWTRGGTLVVVALAAALLRDDPTLSPGLRSSF